MKKWLHKLLSPILMCVIAIAAVLMGVFYFQMISRRIYEDSTSHLTEIYGQVNRSFGAFVERNWGLLGGWRDHFLLEDESEQGRTAELIAGQQQYWGFSEFYFLSKDGGCMTLKGDTGDMKLGEIWDNLLLQEPVIAGYTLPAGQEITLFAVPAFGERYNGFAYDAIAISYTNADMVSSLNADAFSGNAKCFVIHSDGSVLLSTQSGGSVFSNYLSYLRAGSDLDEESLEGISSDWAEGVSGLLRCRIGGVSHYLLYQPVGYQGLMLLSVVPESVANAGFLMIQKSTIDVLTKIFLLLAAAAVIQVVFRNRKQARKNRMEIQYRELMFDVLSNGVDDIFIMLNKDTFQVEYISPNVERLLGIPVKEIRVNLKVLEKCAVDDTAAIPRQDFTSIPVKDSRSWEVEYRHQSTGERRWYRLTIYHMSIQGVEKYVLVMSDRTQERQMNKNLQDALEAAKSANAAKSNFLSNMSHDIRTPMNAIVGFTVLLERDAWQPEKVREYTRKIAAASNHLLGLINDVLDMSKIESGKTTLNVDTFDLSELVEELRIILMPQAKAKEQSFEIHVQDKMPKLLMGDRLRLNQILLNLLSNAIKYTPAGGKIDFLIGELPRTSQQYARLQFVVRDNGIGMSEEFQKTIFSPFTRENNSAINKIQGTGLGMAITKNLVDLMGGIILLESRPGQGSTFTVELSFALARQEESGQSGQRDVSAAEAVDGKENTLEGMLFLVVEDVDLNAEILSEMLSMEGARCELAVNGQEAVEMFENSQPGHYDMILMDVQMPVMNGYEATRRIRALQHPEAKTIPIIAMTANTFAEDVKNALDAGMDGHLAKPIDMDAVRNMIGKLKNRKKGENLTKQGEAVE